MNETLKELTRRFLGQRQQLLAFIHGMVRDVDVAEELLQEVWIRLAEAAEKDIAVQDVPRWCRGVARNLILHHFRSRRSATVVADSRLVELAERAFEEYGESVWATRQQWLIDCIEALPEHTRMTLRLKYGDGLKTHEIAVVQNRSPEAVMKALSRIRQVLSDCVEGRRRLEGDET
jgi:RNA polymerase sigma-70 factor (ECF subfamily)